MSLDRAAAWLACGTFAMLFTGGVTNEMIGARPIRVDTLVALVIVGALAVASGIVALRHRR